MGLISLTTFRWAYLSLCGFATNFLFIFRKNWLTHLLMFEIHKKKDKTIGSAETLTLPFSPPTPLPSQGQVVRSPAPPYALPPRARCCSGGAKLCARRRRPAPPCNPCALPRRARPAWAGPSRALAGTALRHPTTSPRPSLALA